MKPVLNAVTVSELREAVGEDGFVQIRAQFLESTPREIDEMRGVSDPDDLRRRAHALRGASGSLGASDLQRVCAELEKKLAAGEATAACRPLVARAAEEFAAVRIALEAL